MTEKKNKLSEFESMSFEEAINELEKIVEELEIGPLKLGTREINQMVNFYIC